jgi:hypothetical protein
MPAIYMESAPELTKWGAILYAFLAFGRYASL